MRSRERLTEIHYKYIVKMSGELYNAGDIVRLCLITYYNFTSGCPLSDHNTANVNMLLLCHFKNLPL